MKGFALYLLSTSVLTLSWAEQADTEADKLFDLANGLYKRRLERPSLYGQAIEQYRKFLKRHADDERCDLATLFLGNCLREQRKYQEALEVYLSHQRFKGSENRDTVNFRTGQTYFSLGKHPQAIRCLLKVHNKKVEQNLADSAAFWLGWSYLKNDEPTKAVPVLSKLADAKKNPLVPWANFHLGYAYLETKDFDKAIQRFQKAAAALPQHKAESLFRIAEAYAKLEEYQKAYSAYREIVGKHVDSPFLRRAAFGAVWSLYSAKDYANAIVVYRLVQERKVIPEESRAEAAYIIANCHYETNDLVQALKVYQKVADEFPTSPFAASAGYKACWCLFLQDEFDEMIASGNTFLKRHPTYPEIGNIHFLVGEALYEKKRVSEALTEYQAVVARYPKSPFREKATFKLGLCYLKTTQLEQARKTFRAFASTYPQSELAAKALGRSAECGLSLARLEAKPKLQKAQYEEVARDYKALVEKYRNDKLASDALYQLGVTYLRLDKHSEMIGAFERLVKDYPKHQNLAEAYYWLASENEKAGQDDLAAEYFDRSLKLKPKGAYSDQAKYRLAGLYFKKDPEDERAVNLIVQMLKENLQSNIPEETHLGAADLLLKRGKYDEAIEVYNLFLKKFKGKPTPRLEKAYFGLGDCYFKQSKWQQAIDNFAKAIEFNGEFLSLSRLYSGISHIRLKKTKQAEELLGEVARSGVIELEPKAYYWLGNMRFALAQAMQAGQNKIKQYNLARGEYMRVVILYTKSEVRPECMYRVAECLEQEGFSDEAKKELQDLINEYPGSEFAAKAREKLGNVPGATGGE